MIRPTLAWPRRLPTPLMFMMSLALTGAAMATPASAQQVLDLQNGDQLTGSLSSISGSTWVFSYRGADVEVAVEDIASFTASDPIGLRLSDDAVVAATAATAGGNLVLSLADGSTRTVAFADLAAVGDPADLEALRRIDLGYFTPFRRFWTVNTTLGASLKDGNSNTSAFNFRFDLDRSTDRDGLALSLLMTQEQNPSEETGEREKTAEKFIGDLRADIFPWSRTFLFVQNRYTRDVFKDLDLRVNLNGGTGYRFIRTDNTDLQAALGVGGRWENFVPEDLESESVGTWNVNGSWRQKFGGFEFTTALDANTAFNDFDDYQLLNDNSLTATVIAGLGFRVGVLVEYDNTPVEGSDKTDLTFTTGLNYTLGG